MTEIQAGARTVHIPRRTPRQLQEIQDIGRDLDFTTLPQRWINLVVALDIRAFLIGVYSEPEIVEIMREPGAVKLIYDALRAQIALARELVSDGVIGIDDPLPEVTLQ